MDVQDDELRWIERDYRVKLFLATVACLLGVAWGIAKITGVVMNAPPF